MGATAPIPLGTFDPAKYIITFRGVTLIGINKGSSIKVSRDSVAYTTDTGANGDKVRVKNNDEGGAIEIELMQSSPSNVYLSQMAQLDALDGTGKGAAQMKDLNGDSLASGADAWIEKIADSEYGTEATGRTWKIVIARMVYTVGGAA